MNEQENIQWQIIEKAKQILVKWLKNNNIYTHTIHFIPIDDISLEVYVFYKKDDDIVENQKNGVTEKIKETFINIIYDIDCTRFNEISFVFDSHENVIKNYEGSYFFRLR